MQCLRSLLASQFHVDIWTHVILKIEVSLLLYVRAFNKLFAWDRQVIFVFHVTLVFSAVTIENLDVDAADILINSCAFQEIQSGLHLELRHDKHLFRSDFKLGWVSRIDDAVTVRVCELGHDYLLNYCDCNQVGQQ